MSTQSMAEKMAAMRAKAAEKRAQGKLLPLGIGESVLPPQASSQVPFRAFADDAHGVELASARGMHLPHHDVSATQGRIVHWLHKLGMSRAQFDAWCGYPKPAEWIAHNPHWSLRALVGLLLEELV